MILLKMEKHLKEFHKQIEEGYELAKDVKVKGPFKNIILCGMGGSGIAGDLIADCLDIKIPIFVNKGYDVPRFVDKDSLVFIVSYSGDTEETLSCFKQVKKTKSKIVILTSNGKLGKEKEPIIRLPKGFLPRETVGYQLLSIIRILENSGIIGKKKKDVEESLKIIKNFDKDEAKEIAEKLERKVPILFAPEHYNSVLTRWKCQFNENSKTLAHTALFTELVHNEAEIDFSNDAYLIILRDEDENSNLKKHIEAAKEFLPKADEIILEGSFKLARLIYGVHFGDWVSYYLARIKGVDPETNPTIDKIKNVLR